MEVKDIGCCWLEHVCGRVSWRGKSCRQDSPSPPSPDSAPGRGRLHSSQRGLWNADLFISFQWVALKQLPTAFKPKTDILTWPTKSEDWPWPISAALTHNCYVPRDTLAASQATFLLPWGHGLLFPLPGRLSYSTCFEELASTNALALNPGVFFWENFSLGPWSGHKNI